MVEPSIYPEGAGTATVEMLGETPYVGNLGSGTAKAYRLTATANQDWKFDHWEIDNHHYSHIQYLESEPEIIDETTTSEHTANPFDHEIGTFIDGSVTPNELNFTYNPETSRRTGYFYYERSKIVAHFRRRCVTKIHCEESSQHPGGSVSPTEEATIESGGEGDGVSKYITATPFENKFFRYWTQSGYNICDGIRTEMPAVDFPFSNKRSPNFRTTAIRGTTFWTLTAHFRNATHMPNCGVNGDILFSSRHGDSNPVVGDY